jgi:deoxyribodipyrimidine photo-lyase
MKIHKGSFQLFWFRRDLRLEDNHGLFKALESGTTLPIFIFDETILEKLENRSDARVSFIHQEVNKIKETLEKIGRTLLILHGNPIDCLKKLISENTITAVFANSDYEPYARERDKEVYEMLLANAIPFNAFKDHVIFEKKDVLKDDGKPYTVFTPYSRKWKSHLEKNPIVAFPSEEKLENLLKISPLSIPSLEDLGFKPTKLEFPASKPDIGIIKTYIETRDFPSIPGTSRIGLHLRFGTVSIRAMVKIALQTSPKWLDELIWREFYQMIIYFYPRTVHSSFHEKYDRIQWENDISKFEKWCAGKTGYPIVDAGMRELNATGYMHNRVRMVVASFLTKHLLIDWRLGERYFASNLLDFELASNVGGWQWAAGCGCDAAPYFRVFNPTLQQQKFDPEMRYIRKWVPELNSGSYPLPMIDHTFARNRAIATYKAALDGNT